MGMAVDVSVIIFERVKKNLKWFTLKNAISKVSAFYSAIIDANIITLFTNVILILWTRSVKGFAVVMIVGVLALI
jgi:preprotein translocase subunit SecD